jgi:hypothetical protein
MTHAKMLTALGGATSVVPSRPGLTRLPVQVTTADGMR